MTSRLPVLCKLAVAIALSVTFGASSARADFIFNLGNSNLGSSYSGPFAQVDVHLTSSTTATVTFTSLSANGNIYLMGGAGTVGLNVNSTNFNASKITLSNSGTGFTAGWVTKIGSGNENGFGNFNLKIDTFDGFTHSSDTVRLTLKDLGGTWSSASAVLTPNSNGSLAATHVFVTTSPANAANGAIVTGYSSNGAEVLATPAPSSTILLASGVPFLALGCWMRRRKQLSPVY